MKKKAILLPGQGSAYIGMGKLLCEKYEIARDTFNQASDAIGMDLKELCFASDNSKLIKTSNAQPAILTTSVAAFRVLKDRTGLKAHYFAGHSLGEFSALCCADAIDLEDAVRLVRKRGELMDESRDITKGVMTAVGKLPSEMIDEVCKEVSEPFNIVSISNYNSKEQNVISGNLDAVTKAENKLLTLGASLKRLNVSAPFHSPLMKEASERFRDIISDYEFREPSVPVISNVTARAHVKDEIKDLLVEQITSPVKRVSTMNYLKDENIKIAIDIGPGKILKNLMISNFKSIKSLSYDIKDDICEIEKLIIQDKPIPFVSRCMGIAVSTKNNFSDDLLEEEVIKSYKALSDMQSQIDRDNRAARKEEEKIAEDLLIKLLKAKGSDKNEIDKRITQLYLDTGSY